MASKDDLGDQYEVEALRDTLKELRARTGLSQPQVARAVGTSQPSVARWESPDPRRITVPTWEQLSALLALYEVDADQRGRVEKLRREIDEARMPSMGMVLSRSSQMQRRIFELEQRSDRIATFMPMIIPGSVQTESYMRAIFAGSGVSGSELEGSVSNRLARRDLFNDESGRTWLLITTEGALTWRLGGAAVMAEQCQYLADFQHPRVQLGVIAAETAVDMVLTNGIELYLGDTSEIVMGTLAGTALIPEDDVKFAPILATFDRASRLATFGHAAQEIFARHAQTYRETAEQAG